MGFLTAWRVFIDLQIFLTFGKYCNGVKKMISYVGRFVLGLIIEELSNEIFLAVVGNIVEYLVNGNRQNLNVLAAIGTIVEDLVDGNQEDANKWFECNEGNVMTSIAVTFNDEKFDQEDAIETGNNNNPDDLFCSNFSNLPLPFSGITFFGIESFHFLVLPLLSFYLLLA